MKPTCSECKHAELDPGYPSGQEDPGCPASATCMLGSEVPTDVLTYNTEMKEISDGIREWVKTYRSKNVYHNPPCHDEVAELCPCFEPKSVGKCSVCKRDIEAPNYTWTLIVNGFWGDLPVCSFKCRDEGQTKADAEYKEHARQADEEGKG